MFGFLNVNKPSGPSSRTCVDRVQRYLRPTKVGHAGTLDPLASGVLLIAVGAATRLIPYLHRFPKTYFAEFQLGLSSPSDDLETPCDPVRLSEGITEAEIQRQLQSFSGPIQQRPPAYSAVKLCGQRAYRRARRGESVELTSRTVIIHQADVVRWQTPRLQIALTCSTGTYVRSLGRDLAERLGTSAVMTSLVRTSVGPFTLEHATPLDELSPDVIGTRLAPAVMAVESLPRQMLTESELRDVFHGRPLIISPQWMLGVSPVPTDDQAQPGEWAAVDEQNQLVAIMEVRADGRSWPASVFVSAPSV